MNPAKAYAHLFSPGGGDEADNYRAPGQITFLRSDHVALDAGKLRDSGARYAFLGVPFDEGNIGKPGSEEGPREFRIASQEYFPYCFEFKVDPEGGSVDCGDVQIPKGNPALSRERIISELCPIYDVSGTTSRLEVYVVLRIMAAIAQSRGELVDQSLRRPAS